MVNKVILIGNAGAEAEVRDLESGVKVATFSLATNENYRDKAGEWQQITEWHRVVTWRLQAEKAERQIKKGAKIYLEGKLSTRKWQDKDGVERYTTEVVANYFRLLDKVEDDSSLPPMVSEGPMSSGPVVNKTTTAEPASQVEDDLPF